MSTPVVRVEHLSKRYRLGEISTGTFVHDANRWWHRLRGRPDPYARIGAVGPGAQLGNSDVWALDDVSFEIQQGEIVGILGRNGAGKSTLLKLLSRITTPTIGVARVKGRLASLLEVGTGFHPELTGRENVYLNGAIMGMSRAEVRRKFEDIAQFSGVERFLDTPVKRYSSGMYVRLAFAVAAHLDPDVLVVDEVLAVGDADFQKRCIDRMGAVAKSGRTVLFVSHNISAVQALCNTAITLERGRLAAHTHDVMGEVSRYLTLLKEEQQFELPISLSDEVTLTNFSPSSTQITSGDSLSVDLSMEISRPTRITDCALVILDSKGTRVAVADGRLSGCVPLKHGQGILGLTFALHSLPFVPGTYRIGLYFVSDMTHHYAPALGCVTVLDDSQSNFAQYPIEHRGLVSLDFWAQRCP